MPPLGPKEGEKTEVREGEDSVWRNECGVGGTSSVMLLENDLSNPGVRMVKFAGLRRIPFKGTCTGDGGAEREGEGAEEEERREGERERREGEREGRGGQRAWSHIEVTLKSKITQ